MDNNIKLTCRKEEEIDLYFAEVTYEQGFTCGQGYGKTEDIAVIEACSNAFPYINSRYNDKVLFELCLNWKNEKIKELEEEVNTLNAATSDMSYELQRERRY